MQRLTKAVIPAAGLGTRMWPITKAVPKEMLPVGAKPMIQQVAEEAVASGVEELCVVIRPEKESIRSYFEHPDPPPGGAEQAFEDLRALRRRCSLVFVQQERPNGIGGALLAAREVLAGGSFGMLIPDQLFHGAVPALAQLAEQAPNGGAVVSSMIDVAAGDAGFFPGARGFACEPCGPDARRFKLTGIDTELETAAAEPGPARRGLGFGRTLFPPEIFDFLGPDYTNPVSGEMDLLLTFRRSFGRLTHYGVRLEGEAYDLGTFEGYYHFMPRLGRRLF